MNRIAGALSIHPTLVSQVLAGKKDFTVEQAHRLCGYLGIPRIESDYFLLLVQRDRAGTQDLKEYFTKKISELKEQALKIGHRLKEHRKLGDSERAVFYSSWIYSAIRLFTSTGSGQTVGSVAEQFAIPRKRASEVLTFLAEHGLCAEQNGVYTMGTQHTHLDYGSPFLGRHHSNWRNKAIQRIDDLTTEELMFTSPFSINAKDFRRIREMIVDLIKESSNVIKESPSEDVACLNIDLFLIDHKKKTS